MPSQKTDKSLSVHRGRPSLAQRIKQHLLEASPQELTPKQIAKGLNAKLGSIQKTCRRLTEAGDIQNPHYGFYRTSLMDVIQEVPWKRLKMHGIKVVCDATDTIAPSYLWDTSRLTRSHLASPTMRIHPQNHAFITHLDYDGRLSTITIHPKARVIEVAIGMSRKEDSMTLVEFYGFCSWVQGLFPRIPLSLWEVRQLGWNIDIHPFTMTLVKGMSLQVLKNVWLELYQKERDVVRVGLHGVHELSFPDVLELMKGLLYDAYELATEVKVER